jgi:thioredoxin-related protein
MSKKLIIVLLLICIMLLSSCSSGGGRRVIFDDSDIKADDRMEQLLETIKNKDKDAFKAMFSKQALKEANDFDGGMEYLFGFFKGNVDSWKQERFTSETSSEYGKKSVKLISWYKVATDKGKYKFFIIDYTKDTINPDNAGLYTLRVIKAKDEDTQFTYMEDMEIAGIYKPKE